MAVWAMVSGKVMVRLAGSMTFPAPGDPRNPEHVFKLLIHGFDLDELGFDHVVDTCCEERLSRSMSEPRNTTSVPTMS